MERSSEKVANAKSAEYRSIKEFERVFFPNAHKDLVITQASSESFGETLARESLQRVVRQVFGKK